MVKSREKNPEVKKMLGTKTGASGPLEKGTPLKQKRRERGKGKAGGADKLGPK